MNALTPNPDLDSVTDNRFTAPLASFAHLRSSVRGLVSTRMSRTFYFLDFLAYPVLIFTFLWRACADTGLKIFPSLILFLLGYASWTLVEYLFHRFIFHHMPPFSRLHEAHHAKPCALIGTPTLLSLILFLVLAYVPMRAVFGFSAASAWFAGMLTGYMSYITIHYLVHHHTGIEMRLFRRMRRNHAAHHYHDGNSNFGVTTEFWDRIFQTQHR